MKKITKPRLLFMMIVVITFFLISNIFGYSTSNFKPQYGVTTARVNFRKFANTNSSSIIKTLNKNTKLKLVGTANNFYIVELENSQVGLVSKDYVKISGTSLPNAKIYENLKKYYATVNVSKAVVRSGPSTSYSYYYQLVKGAQVEVIGRIGNFSMIVSKNNLVGLIREDLLTKVTTSTSNNNNTSNNTSNSNVTLNNTPKISTINTYLTEKNELFNLINNARKNAGVSTLQKDDSLYNAAQVKTDDMVNKNYFAHNSPTYGTPFELMKDLGISFKKAGENIAGNTSVKGAFDSWMNSTSHKANILSTNYNYIGIGISKSKTYGYVFSTMFIGK